MDSIQFNNAKKGLCFVCGLTIKHNDHRKCAEKARELREKDAGKKKKLYAKAVASYKSGSLPWFAKR